MRGFSLARLSIALGLGILLFSAAWGAAPTAADKAFATAQQLYALGVDDNAIGEFTKFIAAYPTDLRLPQARFMLGRCYERTKKYDLALATYSDVITKATAPEYSPVRAECHFQMGECYRTKLDYEKAGVSYGNSLKLELKQDLRAHAQYWQGECAYQLGSFEIALGAYRKVTQQYPAHALAPWAYYSAGMAEMKLQRHTDAIADFERVAADYKDSEVAADARLNLCLAYSERAKNGKDDTLKANDRLKAVELFTALIDDAATSAATKRQALLELAELQFERTDYSLAAEAYAKALEGMSQDELKTKMAADIRLMRGHALLNGAKYDEAAAVYDEVAKSPFKETALQAQFWLGHCWYQQARKSKKADQYENAIAAFSAFLMKYTDNPSQAAQATLYLGYCYEDLFNTGNQEARNKALDAFTQVIKKWGSSREARDANIGIARMTNDLSIAEIKSLVDLPPGAAAWSVRLRLAREHFAAERYKEAETAANDVIATKPTADILAQAYYLVGAARQKLNKPQEAINAFNEVMKNTPSDELASYSKRGLVQAYLDLKDFTNALAAAQALIAMNPSTTDPDEAKIEQAERLMYLAEAYSGKNDTAKALETYRKVATDYPTTPAAPNALMLGGWAAEKAKDTAKAIECYRTLIADFPDNDLVAEAFFRLGLKLAEQRAYAEAIAAFKNVPSSHKFGAQAAYEIAWAYQDMQQPDEALAQFAALAEKFPTSPLAADSRYRIGEYYLQNKDYFKAMTAFNSALDAVGQGKLGPTISYKLGVSAFQAEKYDVAADAFGKLAANYPTSEFVAESLFWKGQSLEKGDQFTRARDAYLQYITKNPAGERLLDAQLGAGRALIGAKQYAMARTDLEKTLQLCIESSKGDNIKLSERAKNVSPEAQFLIGQSWFEERNYRQALTEYAGVSVYALEPFYSNSRLCMVECSALLGDRENAQNILNGLMATPGFAESEAAKEAPKIAEKYGLKL